MLPTKRNNHAIFIEGLPVECMETDLIKLFQPCGKVSAVTMHRQPSPSLPPPRPNSLSASVEFPVREQAEAAVYLLETSVIWGRRISARLVTPQVAPAQSLSNPLSSNGSLSSGGSNSKSLRSAQVHISYLTKQLVTIVTEQMILDLFSTFGKVVEVSLKKKCVDTEMCIQNGYGFVHYPLTAEGIESALRAVETLHQVTINNISYDCSVSNQLKQVLVSTGRLPPSAITATATAGTTSSSTASSVSGIPSSSSLKQQQQQLSSSSWWEEQQEMSSAASLASSARLPSSLASSTASSANNTSSVGNGERYPSLFNSNNSNNSARSASASSMFPPLNNSPNSTHHQQHQYQQQYQQQQQQYGFAHSSNRDFPDASGSGSGSGSGSSAMWDSSSIGGRVSMQSGATSAYMSSLDGGSSSRHSGHGHGHHGGLLGPTKSSSFVLSPGSSDANDLFGHSNNNNNSSNSSGGSGRYAPIAPNSSLSSGYLNHNNNHNSSNSHLYHQQQQHQQQQYQQYHQTASGSMSIGSGRSSHDHHSHHYSHHSQQQQQQQSSSSYMGLGNVPLIAEDDLPSPSFYPSAATTAVSSSSISTSTSSKLPGVFNKWF